MAENEPIPPPVFELDLGEHGNRLVFKTPDELRLWADEERNKWHWLNEAGSPATDRIWSEHNQFHNQLHNYFNEWNQNRERLPEVNRIFGQLKSIIEQRYSKNRLILNSSSPAAEFILELKTTRSPAVAAGAYVGIISAKFQTGGETRAELLEGIIEAFLYKREIDWTAKAHKQALTKLKSQYDGEIGHQNARFKELEEKNRVLNEVFDAGLKEKTEALQKLHADQTGGSTAVGPPSSAPFRTRRVVMMMTLLASVS